MTRSVDVVERGRDGRVIYREPPGECEFYWEFGGNDVVAIVHVGGEAEWREKVPWPIERRAEILRFVAAEVVRQKAPSCRAEIDERGGFIYLRETRPNGAEPAASGRTRGAGPTSGTGAPASPGAGGAVPGGGGTFPAESWRSVRTVAAAVALAIAVLAGVAVWLKDRLLMIDPGKGTPVGATVRTDAHIATLIVTLEPYMPSLHRDASKDRYRLGIYIVPLDGSKPQLVPITGGLTAGGHSLSRIMGSDGRTLWFDAAGLYGVDLRSFRLVTTAQLRQANPGLDPQWWDNTRGMDVDGRLRIASPDRSQALEIDPATLKASTVAPTRSSRLPFVPSLSTYLSGGYCAAPDTWLAALSASEADAAAKAGRTVRCTEGADDAKGLRRLYRGALEPSARAGYYRLASLVAVGDAEYRGAAFLRVGANAEPMRLTGPDGAMMVHGSAAVPRETLMMARVDATGKLRWNVDTGVDRFTLKQILPGADSVALVGTRPPFSDVLPEPVLVIVDVTTGRTTTHSLWQ